MKKLLLFVLFFQVWNSISAQIDEGQLGAWYMYFYNKDFKNAQFGVQGDIQYRNWNLGGDLEQLLLRSGVTYRPKSTNVKFTLGYGNITTGVFGDSNTKTNESRVYQELLAPQKVGNRFYLTHRFRYEQRWVENQDFRTRYRYNIFLNIPLNQKDLRAKSIYLALYNELFINGQQDIGDGREVEFFDRNRTYLGFGYNLNAKIRFQLGWMNQKTNTFGKSQMQVSMHHSF